MLQCQFAVEWVVLAVSEAEWVGWVDGAEWLEEGLVDGDVVHSLGVEAIQEWECILLMASLQAEVSLQAVVSLLVVVVSRQAMVVMVVMDNVVKEK
jgi:hypothetical protein